MNSLSSLIAPQLTGLPSVLHSIHNSYKTTLVNSAHVHTTSEEFDSVALFLGLPSTLIRHYMNPLIENALQTPGIWKRRLCVFVWTEDILNGPFRKRWRHDSHVSFHPSVPQTQIQNHCPVIGTFSDFSGIVWAENIWCVFRVKTPSSNFLREVYTGLK